MRRVGAFGVCCALTAIAAAAAGSSASAAAPEFFECTKTVKVDKHFTGKFDDKHCSEENAEGHGEFELQPGIGKGKTFRSGPGEARVDIPASSSAITCRSAKETGELTSPTSMAVVLEWSGCEWVTGECHTPGALPGRIVSNSLQGNFGYLSKAPLKVGVSLTAEGAPWPTLQCSGVNLTIEGGVIGQVSADINTFSKLTEDTYKELEGLQEWTAFEGGPTVGLQVRVNGNPATSAGLREGIVVKGEELELKA